MFASAPSCLMKQLGHYIDEAFKELHPQLDTYMSGIPRLMWGFISSRLSDELVRGCGSELNTEMCKLVPSSGATCPVTPLPPLLHSPASSGMCLFLFISHLSHAAYSSFTTTAFLLADPPPPPPPHTPIRPTSNPLTWGIQFVLYVSFLLRFRFISCWLLLINSLDMQ